MPRQINGQTYYETSEICRIVGISRATLFRWLRRGVLPAVSKDRRGWRLYTEDALRRIKNEANRIDISNTCADVEDQRPTVIVKGAGLSTIIH